MVVTVGLSQFAKAVLSPCSPDYFVWTENVLVHLHFLEFVPCASVTRLHFVPRASVTRLHFVPHASVTRLHFVPRASVTRLHFVPHASVTQLHYIASSGLTLSYLGAQILALP